MSTYAIDALDNFIREELPATIMESLPEVAPVYKYIESTSLGVQRNGIGRDWEIEHLFATGLAGLIQNSDVRGALFDTNTTYPQSLVLDPTSPGIDIFPAATATPHTTSLKRVLSLGMTTGNFSIPLTWISGDALSASQIKQVTREIQAVGQLRSLYEAQSFFMNSNNTLAQIGTVDVSTDGDGYITFTINPGTGRVSFFRVGMMVDILCNSGGTAALNYTDGTPQFGTATDGSDVKNYTNSGATYYDPIIVADVNYLTGTIKLASVKATDMGTYGGGATAVAAYDWVIMRGCGTVSTREQKSWGLEDWIKSSGYILGGTSGTVALDLDTYSQFKSQVVNVAGPLTDSVMNGYIGGFLDAYPGQTLDTIITTQGVTLKYLEQPSLYNNRMIYDRTNSPLSVAGGWDEVSYSFNGRKFRWITSPMCITGNLYAIKMGNGNIKRYIPPAAPGSGRDGRVGSEVEFLAPLGGGSSIFKIAHASSGASQALLEAPFWQYCLVAPVDVKSVKLYGLTEAVMN